MITTMETSNMAAQVPHRARSHQPCASCGMLRKRCDRDCILAPYFPSYEVEKFAGVHKVFGASNAIKMIQMEESRREDAVKAIIYEEAAARLRDPVYGSAGAIFHLQKMIEDLKTQLDSIRTETLLLQEQRDQLLGILKNVHHMDPVSPCISPRLVPLFPYPMMIHWVMIFLHFPLRLTRFFEDKKQRETYTIATVMVCRKILGEKIHIFSVSKNSHGVMVQPYSQRMVGGRW